jgi:ABC-type spermidine/putrescine transport system permease subunit II
MRILPIAVFLALPSIAEACAVCFQARTDDTRIAFIVSTAAMTFLPLVVVGGLAWWVRRKFGQAEAKALSGSK